MLVIPLKCLEWNHQELTSFRCRRVCTIRYTNVGGVTVSFWPPRISMGFLTSEWQLNLISEDGSSPTKVHRKGFFLKKAHLSYRQQLLRKDGRWQLLLPRSFSPPPQRISLLIKFSTGREHQPKFVPEQRNKNNHIRIIPIFILQGFVFLACQTIQTYSLVLVSLTAPTIARNSNNKILSPFQGREDRFCILSCLYL
jgi:hypothetical protein